MRPNIRGKAMALNGDKTTTGASCIATVTTAICNGKPMLRVGDPTTPCPKCKQLGKVMTGENSFMNLGQLQAVDGSIVQCGCPYGANKVIAGDPPVMSRAFSPVSSENQYQSQQRAEPSHNYASSSPAYAEQKEKDNRIRIDAQHLIDCADELCEKHLYYPDIKNAFKSQIEAFAYMIVNQVESGQKSYEQGSAELKKEEKSLQEQVFDLITNGLSVIGGVALTGIGIGLCSTGFGCLIGAPLMAHGINGIYEGTAGIVERRGDVQGPLREGYKQAAKALGFSEAVGNLAYDLIDLGISAASKLKLVPKLNEYGNSNKNLFFKEYMRKDLEHAYKQLKSWGLTFEIVNDGLAITKIKDDVKNLVVIDKENNHVSLVIGEPEKITNVKEILEDCYIAIYITSGPDGDDSPNRIRVCHDKDGNRYQFDMNE